MIRLILNDVTLVGESKQIKTSFLEGTHLVIPRVGDSLWLVGGIEAIVVKVMFDYSGVSENGTTSVQVDYQCNE